MPVTTLFTPALRQWRFLVALFWLAPLLLALAPARSSAAPLTDAEIPPALKAWVPWVLHDNPERNCPLVYNDSQANRLCSWPSRLTLTLSDHGGNLVMNSTQFSPGWQSLPGDSKHWPLDAKVDGSAAPVVAVDDVPSLYLPAGAHRIEANFSWTSLPEALPVPDEVGLISLSVDGHPRPFPSRNADHAVWLGKATPVSADATDHLSVKAFRLVDDAIPLTLTTHLDLEVGGRVREAVLGPALPEGFVPLSLSGSLPARLDDAGKLHVQLRPGLWSVELTSRAPGPVQTLTPSKLEDPWPSEEIWSFAAHADLRVVDVSGAPPVDPRQTELPPAWRGYPAFAMAPDTTLTLTERQRGNANAAPDRISLNRQLWLDFDGRGYTAQDQLSGQLHRHWRLEAVPAVALGRVTVNGDAQLITHNNPADKTTALAGGSGVETRQSVLNASADSRLMSNAEGLPVAGWNLDFSDISTTLHLPPGWRLLATHGSDNVPTTWVSRWTLLDLFIVLVISVAALRLFGRACGALTLAGLTLIWHEPNAPHWTWLNLVVASAIVIALPDSFRQHSLMRWLRRYTFLSAALLVILALPFMVQQARWALYPQLETSAPSSGEMDEYDANSIAAPSQRERTDADSELAAPAAPPPPAPMARPMMLESPPITGAELARQQVSTMMSSASIAAKEPAKSMAQSALNKLAPNALTQTGPGLPTWHWTQVNFSWNGPVAVDQQIDLWLLPPWLVRLWRVLSILAIGLVVGSWLQQIRQRSADSPNSASSGHSGSGLPGSGLSGTGPSVTGSSVAGLAAVGLAIGLGFSALLTSSAVHAQDTPSTNPATNPSGATAPIVPRPPESEILDTLKNRLLAAPDCAGHCADAGRLSLAVSGEQLSVRLDVEALAEVALPLPIPADTGTAQGSLWQPAIVTVDGHDAPLQRDSGSGELWVNVSKGRHEVLMSGPLTGLNQVQLPLSLKPHAVQISANGWLVSGVEDDGSVGEALQLAREQSQTATANAAGETGSSQTLPRFLTVTRTLHLGQNWSVDTSVERHGSVAAPDVVPIPLLAGESPTTDSVTSKDGNVQISFAANQTEASWSSRLPISEQVHLSAAQSTSYVEVWIVDVSPLWHVESSGLPPVMLEADGYQQPRWQPWPGEQLNLSIRRPSGVEGQVLTIDSSTLTLTPGQRASDLELKMRLRASQGGQHVLTLPADAELIKFNVDGQTLTPRLDGRKLTLNLHPGTQNLALLMRLPTTINLLTSTPDVDLGVPSVNSTLTVKLPANRWILWVNGPTLGPAILFWGLIVVLSAVAIALGKLSRGLNANVKLATPLNTLQWWLLLIGLSQLHLTLAVIAGGFWLVLGAKPQFATRLSPRAYNLLQIALIVYALVTASILFQAVAHGLLGQPDMQITGNGSYASRLNWYQDRSPAVLPNVHVLSVSIWIYRGLMLAWAMWLANALIGWTRWGWERFSAEGLWQRKPTVEAPPLPPSPPGSQ